MINGVVGKEIALRRGPKQRDPLSPLTFILIPDGLNNMFSKIKQEGLLKGLSGSRALSFVNIQDVDDTLIFGQGDIKKANY